MIIFFFIAILTFCGVEVAQGATSHETALSDQEKGEGGQRSSVSTQDHLPLGIEMLSLEAERGVLNALLAWTQDMMQGRASLELPQVLRTDETWLISRFPPHYRKQILQYIGYLVPGAGFEMQPLLNELGEPRQKIESQTFSLLESTIKDMISEREKHMLRYEALSLVLGDDDKFSQFRTHVDQQVNQLEERKADILEFFQTIDPLEGIIAQQRWNLLKARRSREEFLEQKGYTAWMKERSEHQRILDTDLSGLKDVTVIKNEFYKNAWLYYGKDFDAFNHPDTGVSWLWNNVTSPEAANRVNSARIIDDGVEAPGSMLYPELLRYKKDYDQALSKLAKKIKKVREGFKPMPEESPFESLMDTIKTPDLGRALPRLEEEREDHLMAIFYCESESKNIQGLEEGLRTCEENIRKAEEALEEAYMTAKTAWGNYIRLMPPEVQMTEAIKAGLFS